MADMSSLAYSTVLSSSSQIQKFTLTKVLMSLMTLDDGEHDEDGSVVTLTPE